MKKILIAITLLLFSSSLCAATKYDVNKKEPEANTPEGVVVKFIRALKKGDKDACKKLFDKSAMRWYTLQKHVFLVAEIKDVKLYELEKIFAVAQDETNKDGIVRVSLWTKKGTTGLNADYHCKMVNGIWLITFL